MRIRLIDFETTGFPPNAGVLEVGATDLVVRGGEITIEPTWSMLVNPFKANPEMVLHQQALEVHGITREMVADAPPPEVGFRRLMDGADAFGAHNCDFEKQFFAGGEIPWICTLKVARRVYPRATTHKLQDLKVSLGLVMEDEAFAGQAHRAGPDTYVTARLAGHFLASGVTTDELLTWTSGAAPLLEVMPIGKHKGTRFDEIASSYLVWVVENVGDKDVRRAARHHLGLRRKHAQERAAS